MTQGSLLSDTAARLASISETPALDASVLLAHILDRPRAWVMAHPELTLTFQQQQEVERSIARLEHGEPLPYVLGRWEFFGLEFDLTTDVLIPRPETELLVERAVAWLQESPNRNSAADIGTGSGAIAVSIAARFPDVRVLATDISPGALEIAQRNALKFKVADRIDFVQCDLFPQPLSQSAWDKRARGFDLICANLPYIPTATLRNLPIYEREPTIALDGGIDGLDLVRRLLDCGPERLAPGGMMLLELEATNAGKARDLALYRFQNGTIRLHRDLAGHNRLLEITL